MARPKRHLRDFKHDYKQTGAREDVTFANPVRDSHGEYRRFGNRHNDRSRDDRYDGLFESRGERRRRERSSDQFNHRRRSESPPLSPRVTILKHSVNLGDKKANINDQFQSSANQLSPASATSPQIVKPAVSLTQSQLQNASFSSTNQNSSHGHGIPSSHMSQNIEELLNDMIENMPPVIKLIDPDSWSFLEHPASEFLFSDSVTGPGGFTVISVVGMQSVGKSALLNKIAGRNVFKTHRDADNSQAYLRHLTRGVDLHVSKERLLLLDCQPMMTASILDEYISKNSASSNSMLTDACEPEIYVYITSLQLLSFLIAVCDYLIVTSDWILDVHLIKLLATAMMMVGTDAHRAELIFHFPQLKEENRKKIMKTIQTIFGGDSSNIVKDIIDEKISLPRLMKLLHRKNTHYQEINSHSSERSWLYSAQRFWDNSVRKSSLFSDYARLML